MVTRFNFIIFVLFLIGITHEVSGYSDFIGYKYASCITCHHNGHGGGALNDYGRALFATEIAARDIYSKNTDEEAIAAGSGFLGSKPMPWWLTAAAKYRGLWTQSNPGSENKKDKFYNMQTDLSLGIFFDEEQKYLLMTTMGYLAEPRNFSTRREEKPPFAFVKEVYLRTQLNDSLWVYLGVLDKVFGVRHPDHTAVQRGPLGFGAFDQSSGGVVHFIQPNWEFSVNGFVGNPAEKSEDRQKGFSTQVELQSGESFRYGWSYADSKSESLGWKRTAVHLRKGLSKGSSLLSEFGQFENRDLTNTAASTDPGAYVWVQGVMHLRRGYNLLSTLETSKQNLKTDSRQRYKWGIGFLTFPLPRTEFRLGYVQGKSFDPGLPQKDSWQLQSQLHLVW